MDCSDSFQIVLIIMDRFHYPEKLIPQTILNAVMGENIPIYGDGTQIRRLVIC